MTPSHPFGGRRSGTHCLSWQILKKSFNGVQLSETCRNGEAMKDTGQCHLHNSVHANDSFFYLNENEKQR